jgi:hypothetical protein
MGALRVSAPIADDDSGSEDEIVLVDADAYAD